METGLTAVDGATVISDYFEPPAFGAKILSGDGVHRVDQVLLTEPIEGIPDTTVDQRNAIALVASQDGQFTVFAWSSIREMVHAYRLEAATYLTCSTTLGLTRHRRKDPRP